MKKNKNIIITIAILIILCIAATIKTIDHNDTFYLIKLGEHISKNGIDLLDHFSWIPNLNYTYPHWLYSVITYFIYNNWNYTGIYISNILVYITLILSIYFIVYKYNKDNFLAFFVSCISILVLRVFIVARSQSISSILFLWEVYYINELINTGKKKYILYLIIDSLLIANIHGTTWIMFFILFMPFFVSHIIYLLINKKKMKFRFNDKISVEKIENIKLLLIAFGLSLLMGLFTPSRICYTYIFRTMLGNSQNYIQEHSPLVIIKTPIVIVILFLLYFVRGKIKLQDFFMLSGLFLMSFLSIRHLIFIFTIGFIYLASILKNETESNGDYTFQILNRKIFGNKIASIIVVTISIIICGICLYFNNSKEFINKRDYPVDAVKFIKNNLPYQNMRIYNNYDIGSYLLFNDIKVFIDSRCDLYFKEFGNSDIFQDQIDIVKRFNYKEIFDKYNIQYALLYNNEQLNHVMKRDSNFKPIYNDGYFSIYEREMEKQNEK